MKRLLLFIVAALLLPSVAWGAGGEGWTKCDAATYAAATVETDTTVSVGEVLCWQSTNTSIVDSTAFFIDAPSGFLCVDPNVATEGPSTMTIYARHCHAGPKAADVNRCIKTTDTPLDGTEGADGTQKACVRMPPGTGFIDVVVAPGGDEAIVSIRGEP